MSVEFLHSTLNLNQQSSLESFPCCFFFIIFFFCGFIWSLNTTSPTNAPVFQKHLDFYFNSWIVYNVETVLSHVQPQFPDYRLLEHCPCLCLIDGTIKDATVLFFQLPKDQNHTRLIYLHCLLVISAIYIHLNPHVPVPDSPCQSVPLMLEDIEQPNMTQKRAVAVALLLWPNYILYQLFGFIA